MKDLKLQWKEAGLKLANAMAEHQPAIDFKERLETEVGKAGREVTKAENEIKKLDREVKTLRRQDDDYVRSNSHSPDAIVSEFFLALIIRRKLAKKSKTGSWTCARMKICDLRRFANLERGSKLRKPNLRILRINPRTPQSWKDEWFVRQALPFD